MEDQIDNLDDNFEDVMSELMMTQPKKNPMEPKTDLDKEYDIKVKELQLDKELHLLIELKLKRRKR